MKTTVAASKLNTNEGTGTYINAFSIPISSYSGMKDKLCVRPFACRPVCYKQIISSVLCNCLEKLLGK